MFLFSSSLRGLGFVWAGVLALKAAWVGRSNIRTLPFFPLITMSVSKKDVRHTRLHDLVIGIDRPTQFLFFSKNIPIIRMHACMHA